MNKRALTISLCLFLIAGLFFHWPENLRSVHADTTTGSFTIYPCNDTKVDKVIPNTQSWTNDSIIELAWDSSPVEEMRGWFKFNLSTSYIGPLNITTATFYLYMITLVYGDAGTWVLRSIDPSNETYWTDSNITWNNAPTRYNWQEADIFDSSGAGTWLAISLYAGNSTQGLGALQDAYDNNRTKSYQVQDYTTPSYANFTTIDSTSNKPHIVIEYNQTVGSEATTSRPSLTNPSRTYTLDFYTFQDALVNSVSGNTAYPNDSIDQVNLNSGSGIKSMIFSQFNLTFPTNAYWQENGIAKGLYVYGNDSWNMASHEWIALSIVFVGYCDFTFGGYNDLLGLNRTNENWTDATLTYNNMPPTRSSSLSPPVQISRTGFTRFDISTQEDYLRYSIQNTFNYTLINEINSTYSSGIGYNNWRMLEYGFGFSYIEMNIQFGTGATTGPSTILGWFNVPYIFALNLGLGDPSGVGAFIAGMILTFCIYIVLVIPIAYIMRSKKLSIILLTLAVLTPLMILGWLNIGIYALIIILTLLQMGGVFKR